MKTNIQTKIKKLEIIQSVISDLESAIGWTTQSAEKSQAKYEEDSESNKYYAELATEYQTKVATLQELIKVLEEYALK